MAEHHPDNVLGTLAWCNTCRRHTMHAIQGRKVRHCQEHEPTGKSRKQEAADKKREQESANLKLF
jgi:hypothetical protein